jgi:hypothetical protein
MAASTTDYAVDRLDDDGAPSPSERGGINRVERLVWAPTAAGRRLDGAWWPGSLDASAELGALVPLVSEHLGGPVKRASANIDAWDPDQPRRLRVGDGLVRIGWFRTLDPATVTLGRRSDERVTLLVIPPGLDAADARRLLRRLSAASVWPDTPTSVLSGTWPGD